MQSFRRDWMRVTFLFKHFQCSKAHSLCSYKYTSPMMDSLRGSMVSIKQDSIHRFFCAVLSKSINAIPSMPYELQANCYKIAAKDEMLLNIFQRKVDSFIAAKSKF